MKVVYDRVFSTRYQLNNNFIADIERNGDISYIILKKYNPKNNSMHTLNYIESQGLGFGSPSYEARNNNQEKSILDHLNDVSKRQFVKPGKIKFHGFR